MSKVKEDYDGTDVVFNGKADVVVDLRQPGNPTTFMRKDGAGSAGDFREGTVAIRTRNGVLVICAMDLEDQECFDIEYRVGEPDVSKVSASEGYLSIDVDANARDIAALGFIGGERVAFEDAKSEDFGSKRKVKATSSQAARLVALVVDKEE